LNDITHINKSDTQETNEQMIHRQTSGEEEKRRRNMRNTCTIHNKRKRFSKRNKRLIGLSYLKHFENTHHT